jgi:hypothetical protein
MLLDSIFECGMSIVLKLDRQIKGDEQYLLTGNYYSTGSWNYSLCFVSESDSRDLLKATGK